MKSEGTCEFDVIHVEEPETKALDLKDALIREYLVHQLSNRMKNIIYMRSEEIASNAVEYLRYKDSISGEDKVDFRYTISFVVNDLIEIIGGIKRDSEIKRDSGVIK